MAEDTVKRRFIEHWKYANRTFLEIVWKMCEIHEIKNKAYGGRKLFGNFLESMRFGVEPWKACLVRLSDKVTRLYNLAKKIDDADWKDVNVMESMEDTLIDLANYAVLCLALLKYRAEFNEEP